MTSTDAIRETFTRIQQTQYKKDPTISTEAVTPIEKTNQKIMTKVTKGLEKTQYIFFIKIISIIY